MYQIIDGRQLAHVYEEKIKQEVAELGIKPTLAIILIGNDPASQIYVDSKEKACRRVGIYTEEFLLPEEIEQNKVISLIQDLNEKPTIQGILIQLPLPQHINENSLITALDPNKDVDGFHALNFGRMIYSHGPIPDDLMIPATPKAIMRLIESTGMEISGKKAVIVGRSNIVGKPLAFLLLQKDATVEICHSKTQNLAAETQTADILIVAVGKPNFITENMVKEGSVVIDVGINRMPDPTAPKGYKVVGDVDFEHVAAKTGFITPVPGGVGPMTIMMLLENTIQAAQNTAIV